MRLANLRKMIIETLGKHPTGRTGIVLWSQARRSNAGYTLHEFDETLNSLRTEGVVHCTNKLWWLSDYCKNNYAEVVNG